MKRLPALTPALVALVMLAGPVAAQEEMAVTGKVNGDVMEVYPAPTFTVIIQGRTVTFSAENLSELPTVGENIDITFTREPDGPLTATTVTRSEAGARAEGHHHCRLTGTPLNSLRLKDCSIWRTLPSTPERDRAPADQRPRE